MLKPEAIIVNTSRGPVIDEKALTRTLADHKIFGAGLDVFDQEPPPPDNPLFKLDNVLLTSHFAGPAWDNHDRALPQRVRQRAARRARREAALGCAGAGRAGRGVGSKHDIVRFRAAVARGPAASLRRAGPGLPKYNFTGGNNDGDEIPLDGLVAAANAVMTREGRTLATYGLASGPQGYRRLRDFLVGKLKRDAGISCTADDILMTSGSLQALDLVNGTLLSRGDTVIIEQECYQGSINRLTRLGVNIGRHSARPRRHAHRCAGRGARRSQAQAASGRNTSTPSRPCRTRPAPSCRERAPRRAAAAVGRRTACRSSRTTATPT